MSFFHKQGPKRSKLICVKIFSFDDDGKFLNSFKMTFRDDKTTKEFNETIITKEKDEKVFTVYRISNFDIDDEFCGSRFLFIDDQSRLCGRKQDLKVYHKNE